MERLNELKVKVLKSNFFFFFSGNIMNHNTKYMENRNNVTDCSLGAHTESRVAEDHILFAEQS